ncbi:MAG: histidine phosphatase family protein [Deltaproteobacteria bacterium]|nr:histidine phosphatase family protein [bacterium]MCB9479129.1 histidine phosphatase family protein [Deltaproteobacteria bacterium]MCB9489200.1 histidine phosphatase family protein [Deltaproteobacteria bacterium]
MSTLHIVRHAQASFRKDVYDQLSDLGVTQAECLRDYWVRWGQKFDVIYSGAMKRQTDTATIMMPEISAIDEQDPTVMAEFDEHDTHAIIRHQIAAMSKDDPTIAEEASQMYTDRKVLMRILHMTMHNWQQGLHASDDIETWAAFKKRVESGFREIIDDNGPGKRLCVVTSGGPVAVAMQMALGLTDEMALDLTWNIRNAAVTVFGYDKDGMQLIRFNSVSHLEYHDEPNLLTYL